MIQNLIIITVLVSALLFVVTQCQIVCPGACITKAKAESTGIPVAIPTWNCVYDKNAGTGGSIVWRQCPDCCCMGGCCPAPCLNGGSCNTGKCQCVDGWSGDTCSVKEPSLDCRNRADCSNHGECVAGKCNCESGWLGVACASCDVSKQIICSGHGKCNFDISRCKCAADSCICDTGRAGSQCENQAPTHEPCGVQLCMYQCPDGWWNWCHANENYGTGECCPMLSLYNCPDNSQATNYSIQKFDTMQECMKYDCMDGIGGGAPAGSLEHDQPVCGKKLTNMASHTTTFETRNEDFELEGIDDVDGIRDNNNENGDPYTTFNGSYFKK